MCQHRDKRLDPLISTIKGLVAREEGRRQEKEFDFNRQAMENCWRILGVPELLGMTVGR